MSAVLQAALLLLLGRGLHGSRMQSEGSALCAAKWCSTMDPAVMAHFRDDTQRIHEEADKMCAHYWCQGCKRGPSSPHTMPDCAPEDAEQTLAPAPMMRLKGGRRPEGGGPGAKDGGQAHSPRPGGGPKVLAGRVGPQGADDQQGRVHLHEGLEAHAEHVEPHGVDGQDEKGHLHEDLEVLADLAAPQAEDVPWREHADDGASLGVPPIHEVTTEGVPDAAADKALPDDVLAFEKCWDVPFKHCNKDKAGKSEYGVPKGYTCAKKYICSLDAGGGKGTLFAGPVQSQGVCGTLRMQANHVCLSEGS
mmetsp:Transcript_177119/g.430863  ORF Transcript_177119/g.430863 Transcript_177119/m.430863 type:complete len:306 (-) Transcript_177119:93-1010(-)